MDCREKICLLDSLLLPFGFCYQEKQDIITSALDAWQRQFGYHSLFDRTAHHFGMILDCEPVYFYYMDRTYRIELWKGQYGISLGAEAGIYYADGILPPEQFDSAHFQSVPDDGMMIMELSLCHKGKHLFHFSQKHWWLTGFCAGKYCEPEDLTVWFSITCKNQRMLSAFLESLLNTGYPLSGIMVCDLTVSFLFGRPQTHQPRLAHSLRTGLSQWKNKLSVRLFVRVAAPFSCTLDRLLYLYFFLPAAFRRMFLCRRNRRQKFHKKKGTVHGYGL